MKYWTRLLVSFALFSLATCDSSSSAAPSPSSSSSDSPSSASATSSSSAAPSATQIGDYLPPPPDYDDGKFTTPNTAEDGYIYTKGASMNVTWRTTYPTVNLWLIRGTDYSRPYSIASGTSQTWHKWTVDDHGDNSVPWSFRATNPNGSDDDQLYGGFFTGQFWIEHPKGSSSASIPATAGGSRTTIGSAATTGRHHTASASSGAGGSKPKDSQDPGSSSVAVGAGVGVGCGVLIIALGVFGFWFYRRRNKRKSEKQWPPSGDGSVTSPPQGGSNTQWNYNVQPYYGPGETSQNEYAYSKMPPPVKPYQPAELASDQQTPVEAPGYYQEPRELPGNHPQYK